MNDNYVRNELMKIARILQSYKVTDIPYSRDEKLPSFRTFASTYAAHIKDAIKYGVMEKTGVELKTSDMTLEWSNYLTITEDENGHRHNKYHYYAIYSFYIQNKKMFSAANCNGAIGHVQKETDLTMKYADGPVENIQKAMYAINRHMHSKIQKGYRQTTMKANIN